MSLPPNKFGKCIKIGISKKYKKITSFDIISGSLNFQLGPCYGAVGYLNINEIPKLKKWIAITDNLCIFVEFNRRRNNIVYAFGNFTNDIDSFDLCPSTGINIVLDEESEFKRTLPIRLSTRRA